MAQVVILSILPLIKLNYDSLYFKLIMSLLILIASFLLIFAESILYKTNRLRERQVNREIVSVGEMRMSLIIIGISLSSIIYE